MDEILRRLSEDSTVLDLGCGSGSFRESPGRILRIDRNDSAPCAAGQFVMADAACLPLADSVVDAVVSNHSLEHFAQIDRVLGEIGRTIKPEGTLFVSAPDASTFTDKLYRWLAGGGGHVNAFLDAAPLISRVESRTGLRHSVTRPLFSSLSFLNRSNWPSRPPRKLLFLGAGSEWSLRLYALASRWTDRLLGTRASFYGWALYFGEVSGVDSKGWCNVCIRCGAATSSERLRGTGRVFKRWLVFDCFACPACSAWSFFCDDDDLRRIP